MRPCRKSPPSVSANIAAIVLGWRFPLLEKILATPRFHHWHDRIEREAIDVNFAIHFPILDRIFGTHYLPEEKWPAGYGIKGHPVPKGYLAQLKYPFRREKKKST